MPPVIAVFFVLIGLGAGSALTDSSAPIWRGPVRAHGARFERGRVAPVEYQAWAAHPLYVAAEKTSRHGQPLVCRETFFAITTGRTPVRLQVDGQEQNLDRSWRIEREVIPGERAGATFTFLDPVGGAILAERVLETCCFDPVSPKRCEAPIRKTTFRAGQTGRPELKVWAPRVVPTQFGPDGGLYGSVHVTAEIAGELTEEWYCPRVEFLVPYLPGTTATGTALSTTHSVESDCPPFGEQGNVEPERRWSKDFVLGEGVWTITVRLMKGNTIIAQKHERIIVGGREQNDWS